MGQSDLRRLRRPPTTAYTLSSERKAHLDGPDIDSIFQRVLEMKALAKVGAETPATAESSPKIQPATTVEDDEAIAPSPQTSPYSDHRPALIALIGSMRLALVASRLPSGAR
jgi:hypothetical protein